MRTTLLNILSLLLLSICARSSPIPLQPSSSSTSRPSISDPPTHSIESKSSLTKRTPGEFSIIKPAFTIAEEAKPAAEKDWKRPVVIAISGLGLVTTAGWNYISLKSFLSNRERYRSEQKRLEAEKNKPAPKVGDVMCTIETYSTEEEVGERKPRSLKLPCYRLGAETDNAGGRGGLSKRGIEDSVGKMVEEATTAKVASTRETFHYPTQSWSALSSSSRSTSPGESTRLLSSGSRSEFDPRQRPGVAVPHRTSPFTSNFEEYKAKEEREKVRKGLEKLLKAKGRSGRKISTDDITFGLTVLNTIGGIPSLILTTVNAVYYRGNPRVD